MAIDLARLVVTLEAQNTQYLKKIAASERKLKRFEKQSKKSAVSINNVFKAVAAGLVIRGVTRLVNETRAAIDTQAKFADVIGLTTEQFAGYQLAAKISGVEMNQLNTGLTRFQKNIADSEAGLATATREFDKLGLSATELKKLSTDEQIKAVADSFTGLNNTVDKSSVLLNLFGRSGIALGKLLEQGSDSITRYQEEAVKLGTALSRLDAAKVEAANDALTRANEVFEGAKNKLVVDLAPALQGIAELYREMSLEAVGAGGSVGSLGDVAIEVFGAIGDSVQSVKIFIKALRVGFADFVADYLEFTAKADDFVSLGGFFEGRVVSAEARRQAAQTLREVASEFGAEFDQAFSDRIDKGSFSERLAEKIKQQQAEIAASLEASGSGGPEPSAAVDPGVQKLADQFARLEASLQRQVALYGQTGEAAKLRYDLENSELSKLQDNEKERLLSLAGELDEGKLREDNQKVVDLQQEKFAMMREAALAAAGLDRQLENERFAAEIEALTVQRDRLLELTTINAEAKAALTAQFQQAELDAAMIHAKNLTDIEKEEAEKRNAIKQAQLDAAGNFFGLIGNLAKEGSKAQRVAFAAEKAVAIAKSLMNLQVAISNASALPPPANFAAMAQAAATGAGIIANVRSVAVAHGGLNLDDINMRQDEMTILAQRGERIISRDQNSDLTDMIAQQNNDRLSGGAGRGGGDQSVSPNVGVFIDGDSMMNFVASDRGGAAVMQHIAFNKDEVNTILGRG